MRFRWKKVPHSQDATLRVYQAVFGVSENAPNLVVLFVHIKNPKKKPSAVSGDPGLHPRSKVQDAITGTWTFVISCGAAFRIEVWLNSERPILGGGLVIEGEQAPTFCLKTPDSLKEFFAAYR